MDLCHLPTNRLGMSDDPVVVRPISEERIEDRLELCWGGVEGWRDREVVEESRTWLENVNRAFSPTTFIAYRDGAGDPVGMIEFLPAELIDRFGLVPCRTAPERACWSSDPAAVDTAENAIFLACLWVDQDAQREGVGRTLVTHLLESDVVRDYDGIYTYVTERDAEFVDPDAGVWWPVGPREFYESFGFEAVRNLPDSPCVVLYRSLEP